MPKIEVAPNVYYEVNDRGTGPPIVFIPGWGLGQQIFEGQVYALHDRFRMISLDWRGCGSSSRPTHGNTISRVATDIRVLMEKLGLSGATAVGWSIGGNIAAELALNDPDGRIGGLVSITAGLPKWTNSDGFDLGISHDGVRDWLNSLRDRRPEFLKVFAEGWFYTPRPETSEWMYRQVLNASHFVDDILVDLMKHDLRDSLGDIKVPTAFFHGLHDNNAPLSLAEECTRLLPGSELVVFDRSAHVPFLEEPVEFNRKLADFVTNSVKHPLHY